MIRTVTLGVLLSLAACVAEIGPPPAIPAVPAERVPAPPPSTVTLIWQPGHYDWDGAAFTWTPGQWVPRAGHGPLWQDGAWRRSASGWTWEPAHWL